MTGEAMTGETMTEETMTQSIMNKTEREMFWMGHPRPQMKRNSYFILNGEWKLNGRPIMVPFPPQAALSGYKGEISDTLNYEYAFAIPENFGQDRILLHFGAVDQITEVKVNGVLAGRNEGGYMPFSFDITELVSRKQENYLEVIVKDDLSQDYPYGKQTKNPQGMWYTPVSGIWQTVWLENVPDTYIEKIMITPDLDKVNLKVTCNKPLDFCEVEIRLPDNHLLRGRLSQDSSASNLLSAREMQADIVIPDPVHWTPDKPHLYDIKISAGRDCVESYFALRTICIREINGISRVCLNDEPIFLHGVLDQGYFKDGIFLPEREDEYDKDILLMKELGFNLLRKHIKIEPEYFYYACDRLGILVMQDMVNNGSYSFLRDTLFPTIGFKKRNDKRLNTSEKGRQIFKTHAKRTLEHLYNHPCIVAYTIFNEGWGQFNSDEMYDYVKELDDTRLIDTTSGWYAQTKSDFDSEHIYFRLKRLRVKERPMLVSECGGYKLTVKNHFFGKKEHGYGVCKDKAHLSKKIKTLYEKMIFPYIRAGVCGCIYTQLCDVEGEINGLYTYDREICKVEKEKIWEIGKKLKESSKKAAS